MREKPEVSKTTHSKHLAEKGCPVTNKWTELVTIDIMKRQK